MRLHLTCALVAASQVLGCGRTWLEGEAEPPGCDVDSPCAPDGVYPGPCVEEHMAGPGEGTQRSVYEYEGCMLARALHDHDGDGTADLVVAYSRDGRGRVIRESRSTGPDAVEVWTYLRDEAGRQVLVELDREGDGVVDYHVEYVRDDLGNIVEERAYEEGSLTGLTVTTYDGPGRVVTVEEHQHLCEGLSVFTGETVSRRTTISRDGEGTVTVLVDGLECHVADGVADVVTVRIHDGAGRLVTETVDGGASTPGPPDGMPDSCTAWYYDDDGRRIRVERDGVPCDGITDSASTHRYDEDGFEVAVEHDLDADGDAEEILSYAYDACGNRLEWSSWSEAEGRTVWRHTMDYGCWE